jgi:outer membrane murein-binding lipoprotein Lpp
VGIGTSSPSKKLTVKGNVLAREVIVKPDREIPDYVFEPEYDLPKLEDVSSFIEEEGHLPNVPSAEAVEQNGLRLGEMDATLLRKVEELTLYAIKQKKRADSLASQTDALSKTVQRLRSRDEARRTQFEALSRQNERLRERLDRLEQRIEKFSSDNR